MLVPAHWLSITWVWLLGANHENQYTKTLGWTMRLRTENMLVLYPGFLKDLNAWASDYILWSNLDHMLTLQVIIYQEGGWGPWRLLWKNIDKLQPVPRSVRKKAHRRSWLRPMPTKPTTNNERPHQRNEKRCQQPSLEIRKNGRPIQIWDGQIDITHSNHIKSSEPG